MRPIYELLAQAIQAKGSCNAEWRDIWYLRIENLMETAPSGSGIDSGTKLLITACSDTRLTFGTAFHHMDDNGYYAGWTQHTVVVTATLTGSPSIVVKGRNRNDIKEYLAELFSEWLSSHGEWSTDNLFLRGDVPHAHDYRHSTAIKEGSAS